MKNENKNKFFEFECPVCHKEMSVGMGDGYNKENGVAVYCPHKDCPAQEVAGHGRTAKEAYIIVREKYMAREDR